MSTPNTSKKARPQGHLVSAPAKSKNEGWSHLTCVAAILRNIHLGPTVAKFDRLIPLVLWDFAKPPRPSSGTSLKQRKSLLSHSAPAQVRRRLPATFAYRGWRCASVDMGKLWPPSYIAVEGLRDLHLLDRLVLAPQALITGLANCSQSRGASRTALTGLSGHN